MKIFAPDYYEKFACIADKCKNNCCIGWEIDIDEDTLNYYNSVNGSFGKKLKENICLSDEVAHFTLSTRDRCPFLTENNLCEIFINLGEKNLCQICTDHPRFRNFFDTRIEIGLGLTCEEAARIILSQKEKITLTEIQADCDLTPSSDDEVFFNFRNEIFDIIQNRQVPINQRISNLLSRFDIILPQKTPSEIADIFLSFEQMNDEWTLRLLKLKSLNTQKNSIIFSENFHVAAEQLLVYFIYRHLSDAIFDGKFKERIALSCFCVLIIDLLSYAHFYHNNSFEFADLVEISRLFSSEVEYSEEIYDYLLNELL